MSKQNSAAELHPTHGEWLPASVVMITAATMAAAALLFHRGPSTGHDFDFHLTSWMDALDSWRQGNLYPHWAASANFGAGEPRFVYYPPLTWMLGALLGYFLPWQTVPFAFTALVLAASGTACYRYAREWLPREASTLAAVIYISSPYILFNAYERTAYGELAGGIFLPLILLFALRDRPSIAWLALPVAGIWLTNAPAALMASYLLLFVAIFFSIWLRSWHPIRRAAAGGALGIGLAGFYLVPAILLQRWVEIRQALDEGMRIRDSWLFEHTGHDFHDAVLHTVSWLVVGVFVVALIAALLLWWFERRDSQLDRRLRPAFDCALVVLAGMLFLQFPVSALLWKLPKLEFLQFPWRWLLVASFLTSLLLGALIYRMGLLRKWGAWLVILVLATTASVTAARAFYQYSDNDDEVATVLAQHQSTGVPGTDEYTALDASNDMVPMGMPMVRVLRSISAETARALPMLADGTVQYVQWKPQPASEIPASIRVMRWTSEDHLLSVNSPQAGWAVLKLREFPAWQVTVNGRPANLDDRDDGLLAVQVNRGESLISVQWQTPLPSFFGLLLTLLSAGILLWLHFQHYKRRRSQA